ncbi:MAG: anaerobic ribonucleoside-triphosphate reductase [Candidatus Lokiarchaeota archaeon]|nr:anaerobic ribonucleoside-triphosphate reductase [Candidatus Lokiarchaeota archaeon]
MKSINYEHAAQRKTFVGVVYDVGSRARKESILDGLDPRFSKFHREGRMHIHDLEAYGITYNCLNVNVLAGFPYEDFHGYSNLRKMLGIFEHFKRVIVGLGNEQSGGIGFPNFDIDLEVISERVGLPWDEATRTTLSECIDAFLKWINDARDRCGQVQYYVTLNLGLGTGERARFVTSAVLSRFMRSNNIRPNIIFKVKDGINRREGNPNHDLACLARESTSKKMIPTYLLCDSPHNAQLDPVKIALMGCRTKVYQDEHGEGTTIGRSNIVYTTINLPRIALEVTSEHSELGVEDIIREFEDKWSSVAEVVKDQLLHRYREMCKNGPDDFPCNYAFDLQITSFKAVASMEDVFKHGTLAIGFIGLSEAIDLLTGKKYYSSSENHALAIRIVRGMREIVDKYRRDHGLNFSLLGTSGEFISGRFPGIDKTYYDHPLIEKGFYTNSFHVDVDSKLNPFEKIAFEGPFHKYCNGGCITYVEFKSAPLTNVEAISELIEHAIENDVHYLGFNFPWDQCRDCHATGTFDDCTSCGSKDIKRIRRVSGYLEEAEFFTPGKKAELAHRKPNV